MDMLSVKSVLYNKTFGSSSTQCESPAYVIPEMQNEQLDQCQKELSILKKTIESLTKDLTELKDDKMLSGLKVKELEQQVSDQFEIIQDQASLIEELQQNKLDLTVKIQSLDESLRQYMDKKSTENTEYIHNLAVMREQSKLNNLKLDILGIDDEGASLTISSQSISDSQPHMLENRISFGSEVRNDLIKLSNQIMEINGQQKAIPKTTTSRLNHKNLVLCAFTSQISDKIDQNENCKSDKSMIFSPCKQQAVSVKDTTFYSNWKNRRIIRAKPETIKEDNSSIYQSQGFQGNQNIKDSLQNYNFLSDPNDDASAPNETDSIYGGSSCYQSTFVNSSTVVERQKRARHQKMKSYFTYLMEFKKQQNK